ncbi:hypothetical protein AB6869_02280 [Rahnella rivi]|uniref:hypothetical protein n=1 Tax=Rahnella rivi TaxID=2816249 RepID=UPI0039BE4080
MAFVKEKISKEDFEKYQIGRYDERISNGLHPGSEWAIDREKNIYLMTISLSGREPQDFGLNTILFFFDGEVYIAKVFLDLNKIGGKHWSLHWREHSWSYAPYFSCKKNDRGSMRDVALALKEALLVYRLTGVDSNYDAILDITFDF